MEGRCGENRLPSVSSCASDYVSSWDGDDHEYHVQELSAGDASRAVLSCAPL